MRSSQPGCLHTVVLEMNDSEKPGFFKSLFGQAPKPPPLRASIPLYIPVPTPRAEKEPTANAGIETAWSHVMQNRLGPLLILQEANRYLEKINPMALPYEQRVRLSNIVLDEVTAAIGTLFSRFFNQGGGIPETREQRESISHAVRAAEQLAISYKLLFREEWAGAAEDRAAQEKITVLVLRILECVRL